MVEEAVRVAQQQTKPIKIIKWKIKEGNTVPIGRILLIYEICDCENREQKKLKAAKPGIIDKILVEEGIVVQPGESLYEIKACSHPTIMNDMCAECGADLRNDDQPKSIALVPMIHAIPDLKVSQEQAQKIGQADSDRLIKDRKLVLLVDLDQTLIHTTNDNIPPNIRDVYHFQLYGTKSPWYHTRFRPGTHKFLNKMFSMYELHICTFGTRNYAHMIAMFLDPSQKFFSNRILSRDECFDPTSKKANLKALFPCGDDMVCIIDDREDVWSHALNLIHVKPYHFFQHTGDINAPPGLDKHENDEKEGVDLSKIVNPSSKPETSCKNVELQAADSTQQSTSDNEKIVKNNEDLSKKDNEVIVSCITDINSKIEDNNITNENVIDSSSDALSKVSERENSNEEILVNVNNEDAIKKDNAEAKPSKDQKICIETNEENGELKSVSHPEPIKEKSQKDENFIDIEDADDYLVYLEDILKRIHKTYYEFYDKMESGKIPDLKKIIPHVKRRVLKKCKLVFSGLVPTHYKLEDSKAFQVARSLGAHVQLDIDDESTHLVAVRPGTAKVNAGRRKRNLKIVTPDWLWCCAERWEHADERIFPLNAKGSKNRHPPPHCSSPEHVPSYPEHDTPAMRKRTPSGRFMDSINPLMSFSSDDIADMDKEVEDILDNETDDSEDEQGVAASAEVAEKDEDAADVEDVSFTSLIQSEILDSYGKEDDGERTPTENLNDQDDNLEINKEKMPVNKRCIDDDDDDDDDLPSKKFRRGEYVDELDIDPCQDPDDNDSDSFGAPDEEDDCEWNMMGAALEREFLTD